QALPAISPPSLHDALPICPPSAGANLYPTFGGALEPSQRAIVTRWRFFRCQWPIACSPRHCGTLARHSRGADETRRMPAAKTVKRIFIGARSAATRLQQAPAAAVLGGPALERVERPERAHVVAAPGHVLGDEPTHGAHVEEALGRQPVRRERVVEGRREGAAEPVLERHPEPLLAALEDLARQAVGERRLEQALEPREALQAQARRDAAHELDA